MTNYKNLPSATQNKIQNIIKNYLGYTGSETVTFDDFDQFYSPSGMRYGYIAHNERTNEILICDCTPDDGDTLISIINV